MMKYLTARLARVLSGIALRVVAAATTAAPRPNFVLIFADDISARDLPVYGSAVWSDRSGGGPADPALRAEQETHRDGIYANRGAMQLIRGMHELCDGFDKWWDLTSRPADPIGFAQITDWDAVSDEHRAERACLEAVLPAFAGGAGR